MRNTEPLTLRLLGSPQVSLGPRPLSFATRKTLALLVYLVVEGGRCVGAPIFDYRGRPVAALSLSGPAFRLTRERAEGLSGAVRRIARSVSRQLGYPG